MEDVPIERTAMSAYADTTGGPEASQSHPARKIFEVGGLIAAVVLVAFGIAAIVLGANGINTVHTSLVQEKITGTPDMTPAGIAAEAKKAGISASVGLPTCSVANKEVTEGSRARCFATYMRIHALEATGGLSYSQMPRYASASGNGTNNEKEALLEPKSGKPLENPARNVWIEETALSTALNTSYMASQTATFGIVVGVALLLAGLGFAILTIGGALHSPDRALRFLTRRRGSGKAGGTP
jgi:hypothetical protein